MTDVICIGVDYNFVVHLSYIHDAKGLMSDQNLSEQNLLCSDKFILVTISSSDLYAECCVFSPAISRA